MLLKNKTRLILWVLVVLNAVMIFAFSAQDGQTSSAVSGGVTKVVISVVAPHYDTLPEAEQTQVFRSVHLYVRKTAHFLEYALLGALALALLRSYGVKRRALLFGWLIATGFAVTDEIHQAFSAGRGPRAFDVLIDGAGALVGCLFSLLVCYYIARHHKCKPIKK